MSTTYKPLYTATGTYTISPENVASSSSFVAGQESDALSNISNLYVDLLLSGIWTTHASVAVTANTQVQVWVVPPLKDNLAGTVSWPDVFDGAGSAETVTSAGILQGCGVLAQVLNVDATTTGRTYPARPVSIAACFNNHLPSQHVLFIAHNTGQNSNATAGNHYWAYLPIQDQGV